MKKYLVEQRDENGKLIASNKKGFELIMKPEGVTIDQLLIFANNKDKAWYKSEITGHELGAIAPMNIDGWLAKNGLKRREIYWR